MQSCMMLQALDYLCPLATTCLLTRHLCYDNNHTVGLNKDHLLNCRTDVGIWGTPGTQLLA